jgi:L,D-peptidoglycan transpeptidase YkuD (ErfK/YbiS/YcfS/YnhG family)
MSGRHPLLAVLAFVACLLAGCGSTPVHTSATTARVAAVHARPSSSPEQSTTPAPPSPSVTTTAAPAPVPNATPTPAPAPTPAGTPLPLDLPTADATQVLTVTAPSTRSTTATLQAWQRAGAGWVPVGGAVPAHVGADGLSATPSESTSATPIGSFTLTQAFGHDANPGTALPYLQTTPDDWWISQAGPLYNTHQRCSGTCPFAQGDPNEHLYYETPYYDYAAVIDYNRSPVVQGAGSAFFLHVTDGTPTAGCVAIPVDRLVAILRWLTPSAAPRILIGVGTA